MCRCCLFAVVLSSVSASAGPWPRHTIDDSSRGADGVRLADVDGDGLMDIATAWEEGGVVRAYVNPGPGKANSRWPAVTVGHVKSGEDAVFADLDGDGAVDVVSSCEGKTRTMFVHWAPKDPARYLDGAAWKTEPIPATEGKQRWMFCLPLQVDGKNGTDLIVASKGGGAAIGWLQAPANPRDLSQWKYRQWYDASWIMTLRAVDLDGDGDQDVIASDRKGKTAKVLWLENPGARATADGALWKQRLIGAKGREVMFIDVADLNGDGRLDVAAPVRPRELILLFQPDDLSRSWTEHTVTFSERFGTSKGVRATDVNHDGQLDLVVTCENAKNPLSGVFWLSYRDSIRETHWDEHDLSGPVGVKYDRIELLDLDSDGDLDLLTCEERDQLGVCWYENPTKVTSERDR